MTTKDLWERLIDAMNAVNGDHPGFRAAHAKGIIARGTFVAAHGASRLTKAAHFQGGEVPVTVRFSNAGGNPTISDAERGARGMAVKFHLPGGLAADILAVTNTTFSSRTPEDFLQLLTLRAPDPATGKPNAEALGAYVAAHPETAAAIHSATSTPPPASYATVAYHALHAFKFVDAAGGERWVRYHWEPESGEVLLSDDEAKNRQPDYLQTELPLRLATGPVAFGLWLQVANEGDVLDDSTQVWPDDREMVRGGRMEITAMLEDQAAGDGMIWDPTRIVDGIELSTDPILLARPGAYSVSFARRTK